MGRLGIRLDMCGLGIRLDTSRLGIRLDMSRLGIRLGTGRLGIRLGTGIWVLSLSLEGNGRVVSCGVRVILDLHEARVRQPNVVTVG